MDALDDDGLVQLFGHLSLADLYEMARVRRRFCGVAQRVFSSRYERAVLECGNNERVLWCYVEFFQTFGGSVHALDMLNCPFGADIIVDLAKRYCPLLQQFRLASFQRLRPIAGQLTRLHIFRERYDHVHSISDPAGRIDLTAFFPAHASLRSLTVEDWLDRAVLLPAVRLPALHELRLKGVRLADQVATERFFDLNPQLHTVSLNPLSGRLPDQLEEVVRHGPPMRALIVYGNFRRIDRRFLCRLQLCRNLRTLKICSNYGANVCGAAQCPGRLDGRPFVEPCVGQPNDEADWRHMCRIAASVPHHVGELVFVSARLTFVQIRGFLADASGRVGSVVLEMDRPKFDVAAWIERDAAVMEGIREMAGKWNGRLTVVLRTDDVPAVTEVSVGGDEFCGFE